MERVDGRDRSPHHTTQQHTPVLTSSGILPAAYALHFGVGEKAKHRTAGVGGVIILRIFVNGGGRTFARRVRSVAGRAAQLRVGAREQTLGYSVVEIAVVRVATGHEGDRLARGAR